MNITVFVLFPTVTKYKNYTPRHPMHIYNIAISKTSLVKFQAIFLLSFMGKEKAIPR